VARYASGVRLHWLLFAGSLALVFSAACGGTTQNGDAVTGGGSGSPGTAGSGGGASGNGSAFPFGGSSSLPDGGGLPDARYTDPGCGSAPVKKVSGAHECDPFAAFSECGLGARCIPYVRYADECQTEEIGTACASSGPGVQGDDCATVDCAEGFVCVTGGSGFKCAELCRLVPKGDTCHSGLICSPLDVDGFFVCG
jgi:hypothetical protein